MQVSLSEEVEKRTPTDAISTIYSTLRDWAHNKDSSEISYQQAMSLIRAKGLASELLTACLQEYESLNVWQLDSQNNITFVS